MPTNRRLILSRETLSELTSPELAHVVGGALPSGTTCPFRQCVESDYHCLVNWPTREGCTPAVGG